MPEFNSRQKTSLASTPRVVRSPSEQGRIMVQVATTPPTAAWAQNDTWSTGIVLPKGARILRSGVLSHSAFGSSVTADVGIRDAVTPATVIDVDGIADGLDVAAAGHKSLFSGSLFTGGISNVLAQDSEVYVSLLSANPTDDAQMEIEIHYLAAVA